MVAYENGIDKLSVHGDVENIKKLQHKLLIPNRIIAHVFNLNKIRLKKLFKTCSFKKSIIEMGW